MLTAGARPAHGADVPIRVPFSLSVRQEATLKQLICRDAGFDCDGVLQGETVDDVLAQAGPHAKEVHGVDVTPDMAGQIRTLVRDA